MSACGRSTHDAVVVKVGAVSISKGALDHWIGALGPEQATASTSTHTSAKRRALESLISSEWLIGQAREDHVSATSKEIAERVTQDASSGQTEARELNGDTRLTKTDAEREAAAELASAKIRAVLTNSQPAITRAQTLAYYRRHRQAYLIPERRYFQIVEFRSAAAAMRVKREGEAGRSLAKIVLHEELSRNVHIEPDRAAIDRAILSAKPNVLTGPILFPDAGLYGVFEIKRIVPAAYRPFAQEASAITRRLAVDRQQRALATFVKAWRTKWIAKTDCRAGYVVPPCRQYAGSRRTEELPDLD